MKKIFFILTTIVYNLPEVKFFEKMIFTFKKEKKQIFFAIIILLILAFSFILGSLYFIFTSTLSEKGSGNIIQFATLGVGIINLLIPAALQGFYSKKNSNINLLNFYIEKLLDPSTTSDEIEKLKEIIYENFKINL